MMNLPIAWILGLLAPDPAALTADQVASELQKLYEGTRDFKAAFEQTYQSAIRGDSKVSSGFVYVKKPGMMRWDYQTPNAKHFVADGKALYIYDPELEQVMVDRSFSDSTLTTAVTFLWGRGRLQDEFQVAFAALKPAPGQVRLELTPRKKASFKKLWFLVEQETFRVLETEVEDPGGNLNRIRFSKMAINVGLTEASFQFKIPEGVEVIEAPGS